ncbi:alpha/beta-hydrolase [Paraphaeosphaeria sporulosa]|uniref:Alpha/beta-hydrolase n=1 Tax=Paraphaeosphaeria sporulosa TaxID=1460663 RepID=A0A177C1Q3_9PLEO|nr:alpha/beta-hydrolase [Paraphaeosphaeria sporulosa]OAG00550.1 alpha/beta-hydrolase [Paraphaeosphaeria sporulosa]
MPYTTDPDWAAASARSLQNLGIPPDTPTPRHPRGDVASRRAGAPFYEKLQTLYPEPDTPVKKTRYVTTAPDGQEIPIFGYELEADGEIRNQEGKERPAVLYIHAGGMILCTAEEWDRTVMLDVARTGVPHYSADYRLASEARHPVPVEDCYSALVWLHAQAQHLRIDAARIAVAGLSAGGGLAAAVAIIARDRKLQPPLAKQILLEPMLDDRNIVPNSELAPFVTWDWDDNWTGWNALLGDRTGSEDVEAAAAPARLQDFRGLPRAKQGLR